LKHLNVQICKLNNKTNNKSAAISHLFDMDSI